MEYSTGIGISSKCAEQELVEVTHLYNGIHLHFSELTFVGRLPDLGINLAERSLSDGLYLN